jgi:hypothetical protein
MTDVRAIAARPHPLGSAEHDRVRDYIVGRFRQLGLKVQVLDGKACESRRYRGQVWQECGDLQNIVATISSRRPAEPALAIMAHYDTVASSPGAADDTVGVAAALEVARLLRGSPPQRDIIFLITDGEEAGLLGARAFFADQPLAKHIGAVLNLESRGGGGRVSMFETGPGNGGMIDLFLRTADHPTASSLSGYVYSLMPNDTDFSVSKRLGLPGYNFAFLGRPFDYHAASSTPENLDEGSLQHMGQQGLAAARMLGRLRLLPGRGTDVVYFDVLGGPVIAYPVWAGWALLVDAILLAGLALWLARRAEPLKASDAARGAGALVLAVALSAGACLLVRQLTGVPADFSGGKALMGRFGIYEAALAAACAGTLVLSFLLAGLKQDRFFGAFAGAFLLGLLCSAALQAVAPLAAFLIYWPLLGGAALAVVVAWRWKGERSRPSLSLFLAIAGALGMGEALYYAHLLTLAVGADMAALPAVFVLMAAMVLFPLLWPAAGDRWRMPFVVACLALALGLALYLRVSDPWSARHPKPTSVLYVVDAKGQQWRASLARTLDPWSAKAIGADAAKPVRISLPAIGAADATPARGVNVAPAAPTLTRSPDGAVAIRIPARPGVRKILLEVRSAGQISGARVNGLASSDWAGAGHWDHLIWDAPKDGLSVSFQAPKGAVDVSWLELIDGWPAGAPPLPPRPPKAMPWMDTDSLMLVGSSRLD